MSDSIYDLNCPYCNRVYKLPREKVVKHVGKTIYCRECGKPFSVPPLPSFESGFGQVIEMPVEVGVNGAANGDAANGGAADGAELASTPFAHQSLEITDESAGGAKQRGAVFSDRGKIPELGGGSDVAIDPELPSDADDELPPPFSAATLPAVSDILDIADEPPAVDLKAGADELATSGVLEDLPPYRSTSEHGAIAVEEESSSFMNASTPEGEHADEPLAIPSPSAVEMAAEMAAGMAAGMAEDQEDDPDFARMMSSVISPDVWDAQSKPRASSSDAVNGRGHGRAVASAVSGVRTVPDVPDVPDVPGDAGVTSDIAERTPAAGSIATAAAAAPRHPARIPPPAGNRPITVNLDDVPVARAIDPRRLKAAGPPPAPVVSVDVSGLKSRLTFLSVMSVLIALLLAGILLLIAGWMWGYWPHRT